MPIWTDEHFEIENKERLDQSVYILRDAKAEPIQAIFYNAEIQPIKDNNYIVERLSKECSKENNIVSY